MWNHSFTINGLYESDRLELRIIAYGIFEQQHIGGLGPKRVAYALLRVGESGFEGWLDMRADPPLTSTICGNPLVHVTARFAELQGLLPPIGTVSGIAEVLAAISSGSAAGVEVLGSVSAGQALQPTARHSSE